MIEKIKEEECPKDIMNIRFERFIDVLFPTMKTEFRLFGLDYSKAILLIAKKTNYPEQINPVDSIGETIEKLKRHLYKNRELYEFWLL